MESLDYEERAEINYITEHESRYAKIGVELEKRNVLRNHTPELVFNSYFERYSILNQVHDYEVKWLSTA